VFVFAVSQLSDHLLTHLNWLGAAETAVLLVAVFSVWAYTSFEATSRAAGPRLPDCAQQPVEATQYGCRSGRSRHSSAEVTLIVYPRLWQRGGI
jgi:hypothetical protein